MRFACSAVWRTLLLLPCTFSVTKRKPPITPKVSPPGGACAQPPSRTSSRARLVGARNADPYVPADDGAAQPADHRRAPRLDAPQPGQRLVVAVGVAVAVYQDHLARMRGDELAHAIQQRVETAGA